VDLIPYAEEVFGNKMPFDPTLGPTYHIFPNILSHVNAESYLIFLSIIAAMFTLGIYHQLCALVLWYGWASLLNRNVFIYNPGIPYVGWALLASACIKNSKNSKIPMNIFWLAWFLMGLGYTISGLHKLQCPSWVDGTALIHVLNTPLARDNYIRDLMLSMPTSFLKFSAWGSLGLEILFLPLGMFYHTRFWFWLAYMVFHIGIVTMINFTDLTLGVLIIHLFTFDPKWLSFLDWGKLISVIAPGFYVRIRE